MENLRIKMSLLCVGWYCTCVKRDFAQRCSLRLDVCLLLCHSSCVNFSFVHICRLMQHQFSLACNLLHAKINSTDTCSVKLNVILLPCLLTCIKPEFVQFCCLQMNMPHLLGKLRCFKLNVVLTCC